MSMRPPPDDTQRSRKAAIQRLYRDLEKGDFTFAEQLFSTDFSSSEGGHQQVAGLQSFKDEVLAIHRGYADPRFEILDMIAEGDDVMVRWRTTATHAGELFGFPPTGRRISMDAFALFRFAGERVTERHAVLDRLGLLQQLQEP